MCGLSHQILTLDTFFDQYMYNSTRSPQRPGAGEMVPFLQRPQMAQHLSTSNSQSQKRSEVAVMRGTIPNSFLQQVTQVNLDPCPLTSAFMSTSHYPPRIQRASSARSKPLQRNRARKKSAHRPWYTPMFPSDGPQIVPDLA